MINALERIPLDCCGGFSYHILKRSLRALLVARLTLDTTSPHRFTQVAQEY